MILATGCSNSDPAPAASTCADPTTGDAGGPPKAPRLVGSRLLRRASLVLRGTPPSDTELAAVLAAGDESAQTAFVDKFIDTTLQDPLFYRTMMELGRDWLNVPLVANTADVPEYGPQQQVSIQRCEAGTPHAGAWHYFRGAVNGQGNDVCAGKNQDGTPAEIRTFEPWWAPGTQATLIGQAANTAAQGRLRDMAGNFQPVQCAAVGASGTCGCGPAAGRCHADFQTYPGYEDFLAYAPNGQRRLLSEEPARLFAHIAWFDRPVTDLVTGTYSVGPTNLQAAYVMNGISSGATDMNEDTRWWKPDASAPVDPDHKPGDPTGWREFSISARNPYLLADRDYKFDPRSEAGPMRGIPAAGMLTSPGFLDALPRERLRAARALENLACEVLAPPDPGTKFSRYQRDPYSEGPCQQCHTRIDPAAIFFKRWAKQGNASEGSGAIYPMPGVGPNWHWPKEWRSGVYPYGGSDPFAQWNRWYVHDTGLAPVSQAQIDANPEVVFMDFMPSNMTLLGQHGDGTVGPLGFGKIIVAAGAFDRCVVRKLHARILGREIDPALEAGYLDALTASFVAAGRRVRPLVKAMTTSDIFRSGR